MLISSLILLGVKILSHGTPINIQKKVFLNESAKRNKNIIAIEQSLFSKVINQKKSCLLKVHLKAFGLHMKIKHL